MKDPYMLTPHEVEQDLTWWGYNPHFGWSKCLESALMGIDKKQFDSCKSLYRVDHSHWWRSS